MRTEQIKIYEFKELSKEAQENAINYYRENQEIYLDLFSDGVVEELEERGFKDVKLYYSLSYCQGDGLCFSCSAIDLEELFKHYPYLIDKYAQLLEEDIFLRINKDSHNYQHSNTTSVYYECYNNEVESLVEQLVEEIEEIKQELCKEYEKRGYDEIEYQESEEHIKEEIECNNYEFLENGEVY